MRKKKPRLIDLARKAGVHISTVSRALKNDPRLLPSTREKIQRLAEQLGYRIDPIISSLMSQVRSSNKIEYRETIAFILQTTLEEAGPPIREMYQGAQSRAAQYGYKIDPFFMHEYNKSGKKLSAVLYQRGVNGIVIAPLHVSTGHLSLDWKRFACSTIGHSVVQPRLHRATNNKFRTLRECLRHVRRHGYKKISCCIHEPRDTRVERNWSAAFAVFQEQLPPSRRTRPFLPNVLKHATFRTWFERYKPDAIITLHDEIYAWLEESGLRIPEDIGFAHLELPGMPPRSDLSGMNQNHFQIGAAALDLVVAQLKRNERGIPDFPQTLMLDGTWHEGNTLLQK